MRKGSERGPERRAEAADQARRGRRSALGLHARHPRAQEALSREQRAPLGALPRGRTIEWYPKWQETTGLIREDEKQGRLLKELWAVPAPKVNTETPDVSRDILTRPRG